MTRVTFVTRVTMFKTLRFGVKRPDMCNSVTVSSSTIIEGGEYQLSSVLPGFSKGQGAIRKGHFSAVNGPSKGHFSSVNGPSKGHFSAVN